MAKVIERHIERCKRVIQCKRDKCYNRGNYRGQDKYDRMDEILDKAERIMMSDDMPDLRIKFKEFEWSEGLGTEQT